MILKNPFDFNEFDTFNWFLLQKIYETGNVTLFMVYNILTRHVSDLPLYRRVWYSFNTNRANWWHPLRQTNNIFINCLPTGTMSLELTCSVFVVALRFRCIGITGVSIMTTK